MSRRTQQRATFLTVLVGLIVVGLGIWFGGGSVEQGDGIKVDGAFVAVVLGSVVILLALFPEQLGAFGGWLLRLVKAWRGQR